MHFCFDTVPTLMFIDVSDQKPTTLIRRQRTDSQVHSREREQLLEVWADL